MTDKPTGTTGAEPTALPGTEAVLRWIGHLPIEAVNWRTFPKLGIRGGVGGCTPTVTRDPAGRHAWDIPPPSGACLSPIGVHVHAEDGADLDEAAEADIDPWDAVHRIMRRSARSEGRRGADPDAAAWEILVDIADHIDGRRTAKRLATDGSRRDPRRIAETRETISRALLARINPETAVIAGEVPHRVA